MKSKPFHHHLAVAGLAVALSQTFVILFFDGDKQVDFTLRSPHGIIKGNYALYDGDPETCPAIDAKTNGNIVMNVLRPQRVSHMIVRTRDHKALKDVRVSVQSPHWQDIFNEDLSMLADQPAAPAYRIDFKTKAVTPLNEVPPVIVYRHPDLGSLIQGTPMAAGALKQRADGTLLLPGGGLAGTDTNRNNTTKV